MGRTESAAGIQFVFNPHEVRPQRPTTIRPRYSQYVTVDVPDLSALNHGQPLELGISVRSRAAQTGLDCPPSVAEEIFNAATREEPTARVLITNNAARPITLEPETAILTPFGSQGTEFLSGPDLQKAVDNGNVGIDGKKWKFWYGKYGWKGRQDEIKGVEFQISQGTNSWIPPDLKDEPIALPGGLHSDQFRQHLDGLLVPVTQVAPPSHYLSIAQTHARVHLTDAMGVIPRREFSHPGNDTQTNAPFIYAGNTAWPIRVENWLEDQKPPRSIVIYFAPVG